MSEREKIYCFNPTTGKRDGKWCVWEGGGKCLNCQAEERIAALEADNEKKADTIKRQSETFAEQCEVIHLYQNGHKGGCYACETVGELNIKLSERIAALEEERETDLECIRRQQEELKAQDKRIAALERAIWHNMVDADAGGAPEELVARFVRIWTPEVMD